MKRHHTAAPPSVRVDQSPSATTLPIRTFATIDRKGMGSNLLDIPISFIRPSFSNVREITLKTIPTASKVEIKRVLELMCGLEVEKVRTLNMQGKKRRGGCLVARSDYKKAHVTLKNPLPMSSSFKQELEFQREIETFQRKKRTKQSYRAKQHNTCKF